jgi:spermidine synthase
MVALARTELGFSRRSGFRLRHSDALEGLTTLTTAAWQVVVRDAFIADDVPTHLTTLPYLRQVARVLTPDGLYLANIADPAGSGLLRKEVTLAQQVFSQVWLIGAQAQIRGGKYGNVLLVAHQHPLMLPLLAARLSANGTPVQVYAPTETSKLFGQRSGRLGVEPR